MSFVIKHRDAVILLLRGFFRTNHAKESLKVLHQSQITGWEKWWQIEFGIYLAKSKKVAHWTHEHRVFHPSKIGHRRKSSLVDIGIQFKYIEPQKLFALELKQNINAKKCIDAMALDMGKVLRYENGSDRSPSVYRFTYVGIVPSCESDDEIIELCEECINDNYPDGEGVKILRLGTYFKMIVA